MQERKQVSTLSFGAVLTCGLYSRGTTAHTAPLLQILPPVTIPAGLKFWGVDSGVRHSVGGQDYGSVRAAAFMGLKILSSMAQAQAQQASRRLGNGNGVEEPPKEPTPIGEAATRPGKRPEPEYPFLRLLVLLARMPAMEEASSVLVLSVPPHTAADPSAEPSYLACKPAADSAWLPTLAMLQGQPVTEISLRRTGNGYLANVAPSEFRQFFEESLPEAMEGARFLERFGRHWDGATQVQAGASYPVAQATAHPINENFRVQCFRQALLQPQADTPQLLGELMYQVRHVPLDASRSNPPLCSWVLSPAPPPPARAALCLEDAQSGTSLAAL